jgi:Na+-transporting methylmalonyl-CoA/oxaloacetate decarboxylase gamma subunit
MGIFESLAVGLFTMAIVFSLLLLLFVAIIIMSKVIRAGERMGQKNQERGPAK